MCVEGFLLFGRNQSLVANCVCPSDDGYLVDPASGHMLVSKIKPCMSKHSWQQ